MKRIIPFYLALALLLAPLQFVAESTAAALLPALVTENRKEGPFHSQITRHHQNQDCAILSGNESHMVSCSAFQARESRQLLRLFLTGILFLLFLSSRHWFEVSCLISGNQVPQIRQRILRCIYFTYGL